MKKTYYKGSKHFSDTEVLKFDQETNTVYLKEGVKRKHYRTMEEFGDLWFGTINEEINREALFYDEVIKARRIVDEEKYWINDELEYGK